MRKVILSLALFAVTAIQGMAQDLTAAEWKFMTGDSSEYAAPDFNDSDWKTIKPGEAWEEQGYPGYDGYAWYRVSVVVPASMKRDAFRYGGLMLSLGKIDDADCTYFNGILVGSTGKFPPHYEGQWDTQREYYISPDNIHFGRKNTIAIRVYDYSGNGGLWSSPIRLTTKGIADAIEIAPSFTQPDMIIKGSPDIDIPITVKNGFHRKYDGTLTLNVVSDFGSEIAATTEEVSVAKFMVGNYSFRLTNIYPGFYSVTATLEGKSATTDVKFHFGYEPEKIVSPADPQPDFGEFWDRAKAELAGVDPQYRMIKIDSLCTEGHNVYLVEMRSLGNVLIRGWYQVPAKPGTYPAVMQVPGYSSTIVPSYINYGDDIIGFGLNIRGHGNSRDDVDPGFPGYILTNVEDKEKYIYRGAYMDCVRGIDFLFSRPEVDTARVAVEGASQGGALTFATAALCNNRIAVCVPQVPFMSDFQDYFKVANWPGNEFISYVHNEIQGSWNDIYSVLTYFDIKNLAPMIKAPLLMGVGLKDDVCPPHINFAAYNYVQSEKKYIVYPMAGHSLPGSFHTAKMEWIRTIFGFK